MTAIEIARIVVHRDRGDDYVAVMEQGLKIFTSQPGCSAVELLQGIESPDTFTLIIEWADVDSHTTFRETEEFREYRRTVADLVAEPPTFEHWISRVRGSGA